MLDPWIIEEILRREETVRRDKERGRAELPLDAPIYQERAPRTDQPDDADRGVVVIDI